MDLLVVACGHVLLASRSSVTRRSRTVRPTTKSCEWRARLEAERTVILTLRREGTRNDRRRSAYIRAPPATHRIQANSQICQVRHLNDTPQHKRSLPRAKQLLRRPGQPIASNERRSLP